MDESQLMPVEDDREGDSISFDFVKSKLHKPIRYTGPIFDLGQRLRQEIKLAGEQPDEADKFVLNAWMRELGHEYCRVSNVNEQGSGYIFLNNIEDVIRIALAEFRGPEPDYAVKLIGYKNATIRKLNESIRVLLYGNDAKEYMPGELVICEGGYGPNGEIYNNQSFIVVDSQNGIGPDGIPSISLTLDPHPRMTENAPIWVMHKERGLRMYYDKLNALKAAAKRDPKQWKLFYQFKEQFAVFDYNYGQNSHRA